MRENERMELIRLAKKQEDEAQREFRAIKAERDRLRKAIEAALALYETRQFGIDIVMASRLREALNTSESTSDQ